MFQNCNSLEIIYANPYEWPHNENRNTSAFSNCNSLLLRINADRTNKNQTATKYAVVNGSPYDAGKGKSGEKYAIDSDNNYIGYFTDWSKSPNYAYVYNKYREAHPELNLTALTTNSTNSLNGGRRLTNRFTLSASPAYRTLTAGNGSEDGESPFTAPEVVYLTGKTALSAEAAQNILTGLGLLSTYDPTAYYVSETVTVDGKGVADLVAKWTINSDDQWECAMMVYDPDAECYVWEETVPTGYSSDHDKTSKLFVEKNTGYADITNSKPDAPVPAYGSLALSKLVYLDGEVIPDNMRPDDEFTFKVTLKPKSGDAVPVKARYGGIEFEQNADGTALVGTVAITKTVQNTDQDGTEYGIVLSRIPVDWTYSISEDNTAQITDGRIFSADYSDGGVITTGDIITGTDGSTGTIAEDIKDTNGNITRYNKCVTWRNDIKKSELVLMKSLERKEDDGSGDLTDKVLTETDESAEYAFNVVLTELYPNAEYSYTIGSENIGFTADANGSKTLTVMLKHGSSVKFKDLPVGTVYSVSENIPTESNITYKTKWSKYEGDDANYYATASEANADAEGISMTDRLDKYEWVRFDNTKITQKTIDVNVEKFWFADWYGEAGYKDSAESALVTIQRNDGMHTVTPDDSIRTLDSSNDWKNTFADLPVKVGGRDVSYTLGEITVGGYKPGIISSEVGELVYGTVNTLNDHANQELAYFAYKIGYTFKIGDETYANKAVELCKTADNTVYMFYDGDLYIVTKDGNNNIAVKYAGDNKRVEGRQNRFMKKTDPKAATDYAEVYESYVNGDKTKVYYAKETDTEPITLGQIIVKKGGTDILYIQHSDGVFYKAARTTDGLNWKLGDPAFKWNTSDDVISDTDGNLKYVVTNVKIKTYSVSISKKVDGNLGNKARRFEFDIIAGSLNDEYLVARTYENETTYEKITFTSGVGSIEIGHGETVVINNLPEGTNVLIREREYKEYEVSSADGSGNEGAPKKGGEITVVLDSNQNVTFTNTLVGTLPTGITLNTVTIIVLGLLTGGALLFMKAKQKSEADRSYQE